MSLTAEYNLQKKVLSHLKKAGHSIEHVDSDSDIIGAGSFAIAYKLDSDKVIKFFNSRYGEIDEYKALVGKKTKHVANVYYAEEFNNIGIVVIEYIPENSDEDFILEYDNNGYNGSSYFADFFTDNYSPDKSKDHFIELFIHVFIKENGKGIFIDGYEDEGMEILSQLYDGLVELKKYVGVQAFDLHSENYGKRDNGDYVIFDF